MNKYYENTKNSPPHFLVEKFINMNIKPKTAIDLGCGAGRDTIYLIQNNWKVLSIDKENTKQIIENKLRKDELKNFEFDVQSFENIHLEKTYLLVSNFSIPFCNKTYFNEFWNKIVNCIFKNGYFVGNFFGLNDSWANTKKQMVFLSKEQVLNLFKDFEIIYFDEVQKDGYTAIGKMKYWEIYNVIAKKK